MESGIDIELYNYPLPDNRIAQFALEPRDSSKLLLYNKGVISDHLFSEIPDILPIGTALYFNNAKVIPARLFAKNSNGASIEIFVLKPYLTDYYTALNARSECYWEGMVGNSKKWKENEKLQILAGETELILSRNAENIIHFEWNKGESFADILEKAGNMPLPPYIQHVADAYDAERYQTVFASVSGSVAAPTAGLHFTDEVMELLKKREISENFATLHVSAGTFLPMKVKDALQHTMHTEIFSADINFIRSLKLGKYRIAVGTTACRIMESLYWAAINIKEKRENVFHIEQFAYSNRKHFLGADEAVDILIGYLVERNLTEIHGSTSIMIVPGYTFRMVSGLITNFHQAKSTLLLLISALVGEDWRRVYTHALDSNYRFLSYGDSSLLLP